MAVTSNSESNINTGNATHAPKLDSGLLAVPVEVLHHICVAVRDFQEYDGAIHLVQLALSCKGLYPIIERILFGSLHEGHSKYMARSRRPSPNFRRSNRFILFMRSILERPELGLLVREVSVESFGDAEPYLMNITAKDADIFNIAATRVRMPPLFVQQAMRWVYSPGDTSRSREHDANNSYLFFHDLIEMLLLHAPNLRKFSFPFKQVRGSFPMITTYGIGIPEKLHLLPALTTLTVGHCGIIDKIIGLSAVAPNLSRLRLHRCEVSSITDKIAKDSLAGVTDLSLRDVSLHSDELSALIKLCGKLRRLEYTSKSRDMTFRSPETTSQPIFRVREIVHALEPRRETLQELTIRIGLEWSNELGLMDHGDVGGLTPAEEYLLNSQPGCLGETLPYPLASFPALRHLELNGLALYPRQVDRLASPEQLFLELLPRSLETLIVVNGWKELAEDIQVLAREASVRFPRLQSVVYSDVRERRKRWESKKAFYSPLYESFDTSGVAFREHKEGEYQDKLSFDMWNTTEDPCADDVMPCDEGLPDTEAEKQAWLETILDPANFFI